MGYSLEAIMALLRNITNGDDDLITESCGDIYNELDSDPNTTDLEDELFNLVQDVAACLADDDR